MSTTCPSEQMYFQTQLTCGILKVSFFQKVRFVFQNSQSPQKNIQKTILSLKFEIPAHNGKQLIQISSLG